MTGRSSVDDKEAGGEQGRVSGGQSEEDNSGEKCGDKGEAMSLAGDRGVRTVLTQFPNHSGRQP